MTFLELAQAVARESGTVPEPAVLSSVTGQVGRLASIVLWVARANRMICNKHAEWRFLESEFEADTIAGTPRYTAASWNLSRFAAWKVAGPLEARISLYDLDIGASDEARLHYLPWKDFYQRRLRGEIDADRPIYFTVTPADEIAFSPTPDKAYRVRGIYRRAPKELTSNEDVPDLPERFHDAIMYRAMMMLADFDEAVYTRSQAEAEFRRILGDLERDQLPPITIGSEPIA